MRKLAIVVPVRNEAESIPSLFTRFVAASTELPGPYRIIVVDGISTDDTVDLVRSYADRLPIEIVELDSNIGLGGALERGLLHALSDPEVDIIVTMDGDDSHDPMTVTALVARIEQGHDLVVASRFEDGGEEVGVAGYRKLLSHGASGLLRTLFPVGTIKDYSSGFRAYRVGGLRRVEAKFGRLVTEQGFSCMMELLLKLRSVGVKASEVPLKLRYDLKLSESKMNIGHTIVRYLAVIGKNLSSVRGLNRPVHAEG